MVKVSSWGNYPVIEGEEYFTRDYGHIQNYLRTKDSLIPRGNGRSYGDSALQPKMLSLLGLNRILDFDPASGLLKAEAGVLFSEILEVMVPRGYFLPVTPGTKFITIGGAIASNVHGKNHHKEGAISNFIGEIGLMLEQGNVITCSPSSNSELYRQTIGGMGLTGVMLWAEIRLRKIETSYIHQINHKAKDLNELLSLFDSSQASTYSVAWIDCQRSGKGLGRSILMLGEHARFNAIQSTKEEKNPLLVHSNKHLSVPFPLPSGVLNRWTVSAFNQLYYHKELKKTREFITHYDPFFYPLDKILHWNRIYGRQGFLQYQFVIPYKNGEIGLEKILKKIAASGFASFLAVLKTFGKSTSAESDLSFPQEGYTLALDFPLSSGIFKLLEELDRLVLDFGGRVYLTKDARMSPDTFSKMYPVHFSTSSKFSSLQSLRLKINL